MQSRRALLGAIAIGTPMAALLASMQAAESTKLGPGRKREMLQDVFVLLCTNRLYECRDFYVRHFGFDVAFESSIYIQLHAANERGGGFSLAFMPPDTPFPPIYRSLYDGKGAYITLQVADAKAVFERVRDQGAPVAYPLTDEDWGQRHFATRDPHGTVVDVVQSIDAKPHYYDRYKPTL